MNKEALAIGHERKKAYLKEVMQRRIWKIKPSTLSDREWSMQRKIGFQYAFTDKTLEDLGRQYGGLTREDIRHLNHEFLDNIAKISPPELQVQYPRVVIPDKKPLTQKSREKTSKSKGGISLTVRQQLEQGVRRVGQIAKNTGLSSKQVSKSRQALKDWEGVSKEVFQTENISWEDLERKIEQEQDDKKLQEVLDAIPINIIRAYIARHKKNQSSVFLGSLVSILREKGLYVRSGDVNLVFAVIKDAGIPIKREYSRYQRKEGKKQGFSQVYYVVLSKHADRIIKTLGKHPELFTRLNENPVRLAYGPVSDRHPNTFELKSKGYVSMRNIIAENFGIIVHPRKYFDLMDGSPVSIFSSSSGIFCSSDDLRILLPFLEKRLREMGKIK